MADYFIKNLDQGINPDLFRFLKEHLPYRFSKNVFDWEYARENRVFTYIEDDAKKVVGTQGMIPVSLSSQHRTFRSAKSETSYLAASTQGKGLFKKLYRECIDRTKDKGTELIWGFTALGGLWEKLGFIVKNNCLYTYSIQLRVLNPFRQEPNQSVLAVRHYLSWFKSWFNYLKTAAILKKRTAVTDDRYVFTNRLLGERDIQDLLHRIGSETGDFVCLRMDGEYIDWRINTSPFTDYTCCCVYSSGDKTLMGYYFLAKPKEGAGRLTTAYLSDLCAINKEVKEQLVRHAISSAQRDPRIYQLSMFGNALNKHIREGFDIFRAYGATWFDTGMYIVYLPLAERYALLDQFENWYINGLWTEGPSQ